MQNVRRLCFYFSAQAQVRSMMFTSFYNWVILIVMLICCINGFVRAFEGKNGEYIRSKKNPNK
ncbi:MAG: hypothetical protein J6M64_04985 [Oscillospiraceae bacterium]|nr:hypothetical protein [Oscillospiraceae bacterium]